MFTVELPVEHTAFDFAMSVQGSVADSSVHLSTGLVRFRSRCVYLNGTGKLTFIVHFEKMNIGIRLELVLALTLV